MPIDVRYVGGPRHGRKASLRNTDKAPKHIPFDAKPYNMPQGSYAYSESEVTASGARHVYVWVRS